MTHVQCHKNWQKLHETYTYSKKVSTEFHDSNFRTQLMRMYTSNSAQNFMYIIDGPIMNKTSTNSNSNTAIELYLMG